MTPSTLAFELKKAGTWEQTNIKTTKSLSSKLKTPNQAFGQITTGFAKKPVRQTEKTITTNGRTYKYLATGALKGGSNMTVIFLHGRGGDRHLGFSDKKFEGNFKKVKDLMYRNGGIYVSTDVTNFEDKGTKDLTRLISYFKNKTKNKVVVSCSSMSSFLCWELAKHEKTADMIDGLVFMGGFPDPEYLASGKLKVPENKPAIYFSHGDRDSIYSWRYVDRYSRALRRKSPRYPVKYSLVKGGKHNDPLKKINWFRVLNWMAKL